MFSPALDLPNHEVSRRLRPNPFVLPSKRLSITKPHALNTAQIDADLREAMDEAFRDHRQHTSSRTTDTLRLAEITVMSRCYTGPPKPDRVSDANFAIKSNNINNYRQLGKVFTREHPPPAGAESGFQRPRHLFEDRLDIGVGPARNFERQHLPANFDLALSQLSEFDPALLRIGHLRIFLNSLG